MHNRACILRILLVTNLAVGSAVVGRPAFGQGLIVDAFSREFTLFSNQVHPSPVAIADGHSREFTLFSNQVHPSPVAIADGHSREFTLFSNQVHPSPVAIADGQSREFTVLSNRVHPSPVAIADGHSREFTLLSNRVHPSPVAIGDGHSREITLFSNFVHPSSVAITDVASRELTVWNYWPPSDVEGANNIPAEFTAMPPRPNPFTGQTTLIFGLPRETIVSLSTFDASGRRMGGEVREVRFQAGWHTLKIGDAGWPQGVYFYRLQADQHVRTGKIILRD